MFHSFYKDHLLSVNLFRLPFTSQYSQIKMSSLNENQYLQQQSQQINCLIDLSCEWRPNEFCLPKIDMVRS